MTSYQPDKIQGTPSLSLSLDTPALLRELNHRIKNNFQIIVSLMNLKKRALPPDRREDMRFIEEHVQSMAVAYRLVYATASMTHVSLEELIREVLDGLRRIAGGDEERLRVELFGIEKAINLDHAVALSLFLAVLLPPYVDEAVAAMGEVTVDVRMVGDWVRLSVKGNSPVPVSLDILRNRLVEAFSKQLEGELLVSGATRSLSFRLLPLSAPSHASM